MADSTWKPGNTAGCPTTLGDCWTGTTKTPVGYMVPNPKNLPVIAPLPEGQPDLDPNPEVAICGECGLVLRKVMAYSCSNSRCPCFTRVTL